MYCIVLSMMLSSNEEWMWCSSPRNLQACGYHVPPSVDIACFPWILINPDRNLSATNMFLYLDMVSARICLFSGSIATQIQMYSEPILIKVSSTIYSRIFLFLSCIFKGLYFWIQFQIETWFLLYICDNLSEAFLKDKPEKYKCNP